MKGPCLPGPMTTTTTTVTTMSITIIMTILVMMMITSLYLISASYGCNGSLGAWRDATTLTALFHIRSHIKTNNKTPPFFLGALFARLGKNRFRSPMFAARSEKKPILPIDLWKISVNQKMNILQSDTGPYITSTWQGVVI